MKEGKRVRIKDGKRRLSAEVHWQRITQRHPTKHIETKNVVRLFMPTSLFISTHQLSDYSCFYPVLTSAIL